MKIVPLDHVVTGTVFAEIQKIIVADRSVKNNVHLHPHLHLHLQTHLDDVDGKLMVLSVLLDCVVVHLVGVDPLKNIAPKGVVKVSAKVLLPLIIIQ